MADTPIQPALTPQEWASGYDSRELEIRMKTPGFLGDKRLHASVKATPLGGTMGDQRDFLALAAFALIDSPFGFTRADVALLNKLNAANNYEDGDAFGVLDEELTPDESARLRSLAARIAALLPPPPS